MTFFSRGYISGAVFCQQISTAFCEVVKRRRNIFLVPTGKAGINFVKELTKLCQAFADASSLEGIALKACSLAMLTETTCLKQNQRTCYASGKTVVSLAILIPLGAIGVIGSFFGAGTGDILATNVNCVGNETTITDCPFQTSVFCSHTEDAGVICPPGNSEILKM